MAGLTRGPLAAEVYWRRRLLLLAVAFLLVLGLARVLGGGSDASGSGGPADGTAARAGAEVSLTPAVSGATGPASPTPSTAKQIRQAKKAQRVAKKAAEQAAQAAASAAAVAALPDPEGPCAVTDVTVTPTVPSPVAGRDMVIDLQLSTYFSPACTWKVSADTLAVKITSGVDNIWSSQQCPKAIPTQDVVLRRAVPTTVQVVWNTKRSDESCSARTAWALPDAFYHVFAAALAGEPSDLQFELVAPSPETIVKTAAPDTDTKTKTKTKTKGKGKGKSKKNRG